MTRRRWIADEVRGDRAVLRGTHAAHLARVLRARAGQEFDVACGDGVRRGRVVKVTADEVEFELGDPVAGSEMPSIQVLLAVFKFDRLEWALEKLTELGVESILPVVAWRTDARLAAAAGKRVERWRRLALAASEQARRSAPPEIAIPTRLEEVLERVTAGIVLSGPEEGLRLQQAVAEAGEPLRLAIGPEGGWTDEELAQFREAGWRAAAMGPTILRAETAAIVAVGVALSELFQRG